MNDDDLVQQLRRALDAVVVALVRSLAERREALADRDRLRSILVPLLADPYRGVVPVCIWCGAEKTPGAFRYHKGGCLVLTEDGTGREPRPDPVREPFLEARRPPGADL